MAFIFHKLKSILSKVEIRVRNKLNLRQLDLSNEVEFHPDTHLPKIKVSGKNNKFLFGKKCYLKNLEIKVFGNDNIIEFGNNVRFMGKSDVWIEDSSCKLIVGKNTSFHGVHLAITENNRSIKIGEDCLFAYDIDVRTGDSHSILHMNTNKRLNYAQDVLVGDHVWIAAHVTILKGTQLPDNCVVATRALVTDQFSEPNSMIGGIPAKVLKSGIQWCRERL